MASRRIENLGRRLLHGGDLEAKFEMSSHDRRQLDKKRGSVALGEPRSPEPVEFHVGVDGRERDGQPMMSTMAPPPDAGGGRRRRREKNRESEERKPGDRRASLEASLQGTQVRPIGRFETGFRQTGFRKTGFRHGGGVAA